MGILDALFRPNRNTDKQMRVAEGELAAARGRTDPFFGQQINTAMGAGDAVARLYGLRGAGEQQSALDAWQMSPAAQANLRAGLQAVDQSAAARGMSRSGAALKALQGTGSDLWNQEYYTYLNGLQGLTQGGYGAAQGLMGNAQATGNLAISKGQARDAGNQAGLGNALGIAGTIAGFATGMPTGSTGTLGRLFSGTTQGQANSQFNRWMMGA